jgi:sigma-B regulation protein RsbU (phosphoserine phosphatase)
MVDQFSYEEESIDLQPGDVLVIFSDGVTEAMNPRAEQFGRERLCSVIAESRRTGASVILEKILDAVRLHAGTAPQHDDVTIVVVRRTNT